VFDPGPDFARRTTRAHGPLLLDRLSSRRLELAAAAVLATGEKEVGKRGKEGTAIRRRRSTRQAGSIQPAPRAGGKGRKKKKTRPGAARLIPAHGVRPVFQGPSSALSRGTTRLVLEVGDRRSTKSGRLGARDRLAGTGRCRRRAGSTECDFRKRRARLRRCRFRGTGGLPACLCDSRCGAVS